MKEFISLLKIKLSTFLILVNLFVFFGASHSQGEYSPYLGQISYLLPKDTQIKYLAEGSAESISIDRIVLKILNTHTGQQICRSFSYNRDLIKSFLFSNNNSANKAYDICEMYSLINSKNYFKPFSKKYFLVIYPDHVRTQITGWTTPHNETYIFINQSEYASGLNNIELKLIKILSHELAISLDRKDSIGFGGILDIAKIGIEKTDHNFDFLAIIRNAKVKHTLAAIRAFDFENAIVADLGYPVSKNYIQFSSLACTEKVKFIYPYIDQISNSTSSEQLVNMMMDLSGPSKYISSKASFDEKISRLNEIQIYFNDKTKRNACEYMTEGVPLDSGTSFRGGPGPRVDGW